MPVANRVFETIWDGGGSDTFDLSNYVTDLKVDLRPGRWSVLSETQLANLGDGNYARGNVFNALQYQGDLRSLIENAVGGSGDNRMIGNTADNELWGRTGNDKMFGGKGSDVLRGGAGNDILAGEAGADAFVFATALDASKNVDTIKGFSVRDDTLRLRETIFTALDLGTLAESAFEIGSAADDRLDRIIYNTATGAVFYDADGSGSKAAVEFAQLATKLSLSNSDFVIT